MIRQCVNILLEILSSWLRPSEIACTKYKALSRSTIVQLLPNYAPVCGYPTWSGSIFKFDRNHDDHRKD